MGVHENGASAGNANPATNHYVVINGSGSDSKGSYYTFFDPGTSHESTGASPHNKLYVNSDGSLSGTTAYSGKTYTVTEVRPK